MAEETRRSRGRPREGSRGPQPVVTFALTSLLLFVGIGVGISRYTSQQFLSREQQAARLRAQVVANSMIGYGSAFGRQALGTYVKTQLLRWPIMRVKIWQSDGTVSFSDAANAIGRRFPVDPGVQEAFSKGKTVGAVTALQDPANATERSLDSALYSTYVPIWASPQHVGKPEVVVEVYQDYASIASQAGQLSRTVLVILSLGLAALWLLLLPITHRLSKRLATQNARLRESEQKSRAVIEQIPAITYTDLVKDKMTRTFVSPQVERYLGITPEQWLAEPELWLQSVHPDDREEVEDSFKRAVANREAFSGVYRMVAPDGRTLWFRDEGVMLHDEHGNPRLVQGVMLDISEAKAAEEQLAFLAYHDKLTGLPNRHMFEELLDLSIARARRHDLAVAVLYMDLDDFKLVNDDLGHATGDELLRQVADRLREATRETDLVARQGGDEFLLLLADLDRHPDGPPNETEKAPRLVAESVASRVFESLRPPFTLGEAEFYVSASIGISLFPADASDAEALLKNADAAMYQSKKEGPGNFLVHSDRRDGSISKLSLATRLRNAVERQQWVLHYQPLVDLGTREMVGVEALIRWRDPRGGLVAPGQFIPLAEEMGLIEVIGEWVVAELCRQSNIWRLEGLSTEIGFNLSPRQLWHSDFVLRIMSQLESGGVDPATIVVEITESAAMTDPDRTQRVLWDLHGRGLRLAIDDFGTGYSSLSRLKHLPVDVLKIDRSFVQDTPGDHDACSMVTAMIQLARSLEMTPLAEGIETEEQWRFLLDNGCPLGQGFLFSRPVPAQEISARLDVGRSAASGPA